jgi:hypothetical protein
MPGASLLLELLSRVAVDLGNLHTFVLSAAAGALTPVEGVGHGGYSLAMSAISAADSSGLRAASLMRS